MLLMAVLVIVEYAHPYMLLAEIAFVFFADVAHYDDSVY